jgi:hypothetical protein
VVVDRTLGHLEVAPTPFSPNGDGRLDSATVGFRLARQAETRVWIMDGERVVKVLHPRGTLAAGASSFQWAGRGRSGAIADGTYRAMVEATTALGTRRLSVPVVLDTRAPVLRAVSARLRDGRTRLKVWLSEAATLRLRWASPDWADGGSRLASRPAGYSRLTLPRAMRVRVQGVDAAANAGARVVAQVAR